MSKILDGKQLSSEINQETKKIVENSDKKITLATIFDSANDGSKMYVGMKNKKAAELGIETQEFEIVDSQKTEDIIAIVEKLNADDSINGILVQSPLPKGISEVEVYSAIKKEKDVDGLNYQNQGLLFENIEGYIPPATPSGIIELLIKNEIEIKGKNAVIVGASQLLGRPTAMMLLNRGATVSVAHIDTDKEYLKTLISQADILVVGIGDPEYIQADWIKKDAVIIDAGANKVDGKTVGDIEKKAYEKSSHHTPVPGGVGPMTIAMLLKHVAETSEKNGK